MDSEKGTFWGLYFLKGIYSALFLWLCICMDLRCRSLVMQELNLMAPLAEP